MGVCPQAFNRQWATGASHRAQAQRSTPTNRIVCSHVGASNHARGCLSLAMHRHYIGSKCHVLIMGVRIDNPCMGLSHNVASARWGHQTMPEVPQRSHASALYRHEMPRAYHGRWLWQPVHGAQPPHSRIVRYSRRPQGRGFIAPHLDFPQLAHALLHGVALELQNMGLSHISRFPASFPTISRNFPQAGKFLAGGRSWPSRRRRWPPDVDHGSHEGQATIESVPRWGHQTMPKVPQRSHASALYRQEMPRAYHGRWLWQPVHGAQPPHSRIVRYSRRPQGRGFIAPHLDFPQLAHALLHGVALELQNMGLSHISRFPASFPTISRNFPQAGKFLAGGRSWPSRRRRWPPDVDHGSHEGQATIGSVPKRGESSMAQHSTQGTAARAT